MSSSPTRPSVERIRRATLVDEAIVLMARASHDQKLCEKLLAGHKRVLEAYGIKNLSSFRTDWFRRDDVWIIAVLTPDGERVLAVLGCTRGWSPTIFLCIRLWAMSTAR